MSLQDVAPYHPYHPEVELPPLPPSDNTTVEPPASELVLPPPSDPLSSPSFPLPPLILGCATFGFGIYTTPTSALSLAPLDTIRYALQSGINAFDTAPWYHPSEIILGRALHRLKDEGWGRERYRLITKVGKFGESEEGHDYSPGAVRASVERSLKRLKTNYLDVVYLHDVEFVASAPRPCPAGNPLDVLTSPTSPFQLHTDPSTPLGPGDDLILNALLTLHQFQKSGKILKIGIAGYSLPLLLRLSRLAHSRSIPLDIVQTFAHQSLQNRSLELGYLAEFEKAGVGIVTNAAPLAMGILTSLGGPEWHPVNVEKGALYDACREVSGYCESRGTKLEVVASDFGYRELRMEAGKGREVPVVIGCKNVEEVERALKSWHSARGDGVKVNEEVVKGCLEIFEKRGVANWSWKNGASKPEKK